MKKIIQESKKVIYHSGFYLSNERIKSLHELTIEKLCNIELIDNSDFPYNTAYDFVSGSCDLFALALYKNFKYQPYDIIQNNKLIHCFCIHSYKDYTVYIDVRGITSNFEEFITDTKLNCTDEYYVQFHNIKETAKLQNDWDKEGFSFANAIIKKYYNYYSI